MKLRENFFDLVFLELLKNCFDLSIWLPDMLHIKCIKVEKLRERNLAKLK